MMKRRALLAASALVEIAKPAFARSAFGGGARLPLVPGIYPFSDNGQPQDVATVSAWLGAPITQCLAFVPYGSWTDFAVSGGAAIAGTTNQWAVPLTVSGTTLAQVAAGGYISYFTTLAQNIVTNNPGNALIYVRLGWEFSGYTFGSPGAGFYPWYAIGPNAPTNGAANYVACFQLAVNAFRAVSSRFRFGWCVQNCQGDGAGGYVDPTPCYPGNTYVDYITMDCYFNSAYDNPDPLQAFNYRVHNAGFGLDWCSEYARTQGKLLAVDEWGITSDTYAPIVIMMAEWLRSNQVAYHNYWMSNADVSCDLANNQYPNAATMFISEFAY